jgi:hypothetical protein
MTTPEIVTGNVYWLLALLVVVGLRAPGVWVVMALTKITPFVGPLWFLVRREWRAFGISVLTTAVVVVASYVSWPAAWHAWVSFLEESLGRSREALGSPILPPLVLRLPVALGIVVWGARRGCSAAVPVAMVLATPVIGTASFTVLAAIPRLRTDRLRGMGHGSGDDT